MSIKPIIGSFKMSDEEYFKIDAISNSGFRLLKESVLHYENRNLFPIGSASINIGSAVHKLVLEPSEFHDEYVVENFIGCNENKNSKLYKEAKSEWLKANKGKKVLSEDMFIQISQMAINVNAIAGGLLQNGVAEQAFLSHFDNNLVKCKVDYYNEDSGLVIDLKTTKSIDEFMDIGNRKCPLIKYGYLTQGSLYLDILKSLNKKAEKFIFILVETTAPYMVKIVDMPNSLINIGRTEYQGYFDTWNDYKDFGTVNAVKTYDAPTWWLEKKGN